MSVGGVYTLITNTGVQDKLIMATDDLMARMKKISCNKLAYLKSRYPGKTDRELMNMDSNWMPSLAAIEKTHIMFVNATFKPFVAIAHEYSKTAPRGGGGVKLGNTFNFTMPVYGEFVNDAVVYIKLDNLRAISGLDKVRYIEMLGHRIFKKIKFKLNGTELDSYTADRYNIHWQYKVPQHKELGYLRNIGQETPKLGYLTADPAADEFREYRYFGNGPQTFKTTQTSVEMWIPMLFWFKDIQTALPNFLFPYGQTDIEIDLEQESNLVAYANYSGNPDPIYIPPTVTQCYLYMNHLFMMPMIHKIFVSRFGFQLIRVTRTHRVSSLTKSEDSILLQSLKWPIECMYVGFRPTVNLTNSQKWHRNTVITDRSVSEAVITGGAFYGINSAVYYDEAHVVSSLSLKAHDVVIYPDLAPAFYNSYLSYQFGPNLKTPKDIGWYMFNFNIRPGDYQPSGHFNSSNDRELYLSYVTAQDSSGTNYIRAANPVELIVVADCINFLMIANKTAVLRFST